MNAATAPITPELLLSVWSDIEKRLGHSAGQAFLQKQLAGGSVSLSAAVRVSDGMPGLLLRIDDPPVTMNWAPVRLSGVRFEKRLKIDRGDVLPILLADDGARDLFALLAADLAAAITGIPEAGTAVDAVLRRLALWRKFLQAREGKMSEEEVRGLIAELHVFGRIAAGVGIDAALQAWKGPAGELHDFVLPNLRVEVKSWMNTSLPQITISNPAQIVPDETYPLWLCAVELVASHREGWDLPRWVQETAAIMSLPQKDLLASALADYGYLAAHAELYTIRYAARSAAFHQVTPGFPRIAPEIVPPAVPWLKYGLSLNALQDFIVPEPAYSS